MSGARCKVLFFAEGGTLAHVVRPLALARGLAADQFDVTFCRPAVYHWLSADSTFRVVDLQAQAPAVFARRLECLSPVYDYVTLLRYVDDDLALIDAHSPEVIVGDFRLSLSVSARLRAVPYIAICDAYWSPEYVVKAPLPVLPVTRFLPIAILEPLFQRISPIASHWHARPLERLRARYAMPSLGFDTRRCYSDADLRLFADIPRLFPQVRPAADADYIGPITWFPSQGAAPVFSDAAGPLIYVTMGSSGDPRVLDALLPILEQLECQVIIAGAGKALSFKPASAKIRVFDYLPGDIVCQHAQLVVCNGGSPTTNQALANGVPVLGIAQNMDQFLNMRAIDQYGAGLLVRADRASPSRLRAALAQLLRDGRFGERARELAASLSPEQPSAILARHVCSLRRNSAAAFQ